MPGLGLYVRISEDAESLGLGVDRQTHDGRDVARLRGWDVARVYCDNDYSAFKAKVIRPQFEEMLADLGAGRIDGIITYDIDRFARQPVDLERAIAIYDARPGLLFATVQSDIDLSSPDGRTMARVLVAFANKASMDTSRRVKRKHLELAMNGVPVGGHRPFGLQADKRTLDPREATLVREAAKDILNGVGMHTIARRWNEAGITTTTGGPWRRQVLRTMLLSPRMAGYRTYKGDIARNGDGDPVMSQAAPILDVETWEAVCAVLTDPRKRGQNVHIGGRKYLLSGVVRCGSCLGFLVGNADPRNDTFYYQCKSITGGGCGNGVGITGTKLDPLVEKLVLAHLAEREVEPPEEEWPHEKELAAVRGQISELMDAYATRQLSGDHVFPTVSKLEHQVAELQASRNEWLRSRVGLTKRPSNIVEEWPALDMDQKRDVIQSVVLALVVNRPTKRGPRFDPDRVDVTWHRRS